MLKHYFLTIYRSFLRAKGYFLINLAGLSAGIACAVLIFLWVRDEYRIDRFGVMDDRRYQVMEHQHYVDNIMTTTSTPGLLSETLAEEFPEVELGTATSWVESYTLSVGEHNVKAKGLHVGKDFFLIFPFKLIAGSPDKVMDDKTAMVISKDLAIKLFGPDENPLGKTVEFQHDKVYHVTGVFEAAPPNASMQFEFAISFEVFKDENPWVIEWGNNGPPSYVLLKEGADGNAFSAKIENYLKSKDTVSTITLFAQRYADQYLYSKYENGQQAGGRIDYVQMFSVIAVFILVIACINFMNLATARASEKAREVGIRKSIGAQRRSLVVRYIGESMLVTFLSLVIAMVFVAVFLPQFNVVTGKKIALEWNDSVLWLTLAAITIVTGLVAGSYPAFYLSSFRPTAVLKGEIKGSAGELWARKGLVVFQFFLSVVLIVAVLVVYKQIAFVQTKNLGYVKEHLIKFPIEGKVKSNLQTFLAEARRIPGVINASAVGHNFVGRNSSTIGVEWEGKNPDDRILFENAAVDYGFLETVGVELLEGRSFSEDYGTDTARVIFNEAGIRAMGIDDPVGKRIKIWGQDREIIGVVRDFHYESLHEGVNPLFFRLRPEDTWIIMMRLEAGKERETLSRIEDFYRSFNPGFFFEYKFQDQEYALQYEAEQRVATLSSWFAAIAVIISCLGIFGLATFTAERRRKEIGIRKSLGSSSRDIVVLLSGEFTLMVIVAILIGIPVSYWLLDRWLEQFAFRIELELWYFLASGAVALVIAWLTVASQAIRAARLNPVSCLRVE